MSRFRISFVQVARNHQILVAPSDGAWLRRGFGPPALEVHS